MVHIFALLINNLLYVIVRLLQCFEVVKRRICPRTFTRMSRPPTGPCWKHDVIKVLYSWDDRVLARQPALNTLYSIWCWLPVKNILSYNTIPIIIKYVGVHNTIVVANVAHNNTIVMNKCWP